MARTSARGLSLRLACMQGLCVMYRVIDYLTEKVERRLTDVSHLNDRSWPLAEGRSFPKEAGQATAIGKSRR